MSSCNTANDSPKTYPLYQIGFECQVATQFRKKSNDKKLYQIGFECQVATFFMYLWKQRKLYQIGFECQVATSDVILF